MDQHQSASAKFGRSLAPLRQRAIWLSAMVAIAAAAIAGLAILIVSAWVDLASPLSFNVRKWLLPSALLASVVSAIAWWFWDRSGRREAELVRKVDQSRHENVGVMTGYDLDVASMRSAQQGKADESGSNRFTNSLASIASEQAQRQCAAAEPAVVLPSEQTRKWWFCLGAVASLIILFAIAMPSLAMTQAGRIFRPSEDQLPYSPTSISVSPGDHELLFGEDFEVVATTAGPSLDNLELVLEFDDGAIEVVPMLSDGESRFRTFITRVTDSADYYVLGSGSRSETHRLSVRMTPQFRDIKCRVLPPSYTRQMAYVGLIPRNGIEGLGGTEVSLQIESNRPLSGGVMSIFWDNGEQEQVEVAPIQTKERKVGSPDDAVSPESRRNHSFVKYEVDPGNVVLGHFDIVDSGRFEISLRDIDGIESSQPFEGAIRQLKDRAPVVRLLQPKQVSLATPDVALPIVVAAEDDYGLSLVRLYRGLNQSPPIPVALPFDESNSRARLQTSLPLHQYGLQPGDEITLFARVEDNDPAGAKGAESSIATVRIISREQLAQMQLRKRGVEALVSKQRRIQRLMDSLRKELERAEEASESEKEAQNAEEQSQSEGKDGDSQASKALEQARKAAAEAAAGMREMSRQELPVDIDREMNQRLQEMAKEMDDVAAKLAELQKKSEANGGLSKQEQKEFQELVERVGQQRKKHDQQMMSPTSDLSKILPLAMDQQRFIRLAARQRALATRMNALKEERLDSPDSMRRAEQLRIEQEQLQTALNDLLDDIESHVNALPNDEDLDTLRQTATQFVEEVRQSQADAMMLDTQMSLLDEDHPGASFSCQRAASILESFISQCNSMGDKACKNCKAKFNPSNGCPNPGNSIEQLLAQMGLGGSPGSKPGSGPG
ncbi:MAG: hypothetical protein AAF664_05925, partial [Planctomycetota bacterium]